MNKLIHDNIKRFKCDICNKYFSRSSYLTIHKLIHAGIKNYQCDVCNKVFASQAF